MSRFNLHRAAARILCASLPLSAFVIAGGAHSRPRQAAITPEVQTLFKCETDRVFLLPKMPGVDESESEQSYALGGGRDSKGEIVLSVNLKSHALTLLLQPRGGPMRAYALTNVEQGSSGSSGTAGRADTTIRGRSAGKVFTLFADYENFSDEDALLTIEDHTTALLTCRNGHYEAPRATGLGRYGFTNIFVLRTSDVAQEMKTLPPEPVVQDGKVSFFVPE